MEKIYSKDWYINYFKELETKVNGEFTFHDLRKYAVSKLDKLGFPTTENEEWKYTNVSPIFSFDFTPVWEPGGIKVTSSDIERFTIKGLNVNLLVFVNGFFRKDLSRIHPHAKEVRIQSLAALIKNDPLLVVKYFARYAQFENGFIALNTAFTQDGAVIYVPPNISIEHPIHILHLTSSENGHVLVQPRNLYILGMNARVKIIESYNSLSEKPSFTNAVTEVLAGEHSNSEFYKIQDENLASFHVSRMQIDQKRESSVKSYTVSVGGAITRNDLNTVLNGERINAELYGMYFLEDSQHLDNHTLIDHAKPHCVSNELYKGILNGRSHGVFNGKVYVRPDAQKTNAYQSNKAILLSKEATIDTKPQLEIFADDVKCSHGAAIGQLDEDALFYLRSRGVGEDLARTTLIRAFANDVFETIEMEPVHDHLNELVNKKLR